MPPRFRFWGSMRVGGNPQGRIDLALAPLVQRAAEGSLMAKTDIKTTASNTDQSGAAAAAPSPAGDAYHPETVEAKWQARWAERHTNEPDLEGAKRPFFNLMMFPYPSAEGLHVGNMALSLGIKVTRVPYVKLVSRGMPVCGIFLPNRLTG